MRRREVHVVVGAGVAGCLAAITRSRAGYDVVLIERTRSHSRGMFPICTETSNIVSENHSGAEYPYDPQSARDCLDGRIANELFFPEQIFGGKTYSRIIASQSMEADGHEIVNRCRSNMAVIRSHYTRRCEENPANAVFGDPADVCIEVGGVDQVEDVATAFVTPQRGLNPVLVAAVLHRELRRCGTELREGTTMTAVTPRSDGRYDVECVASEGAREAIVADQVSICAATGSFAVARRLNPALRLPPIFMALREILYVDLPDGTDKNFTCLKLEDAYGGMLSPLNERCAMIYHPPAAHIAVAQVDEHAPALPPAFARALVAGHPETEQRARRTVERLRDFYPELRRSEILGAYLKIAINTVADSRVRRNIGVVAVCPGATMSVLPKWTMCAVNTWRELKLALAHSAALGNATEAEVAELQAEGMRPCAPVSLDSAALVDEATRHAINMDVPKVLARWFDEPATWAPTERLGTG